MKIGFKNFLAILLALALILSCLPACAAADDCDVITGQFTYMPSFVDEPATDSYYYSDGYLSASGSQPSQELLTMSMVLALASMEIGGDSYITALLDDIGYTDIATADMTVAPTIDTIGTAIAHKRVGGHDVVAVSIRGNKYGAEWASNLTAGAQGNIEGFDHAAEKVIARIKEYIAEHRLNNVKLWIAGYSRAGSVADLTGVYINEHPDEFSTTADDLFVYCFEAPRCCASDKKYNNIFCVSNKNDVITYVYPESWGLYTNGVDIVTGDDLTVNKVKIDLLEKEKVIVLGEIPMDEFNVEFISFLADELTREKFSGELDGAVAELIELYFGGSSEDWSGVTQFFRDSDFISNAMDNDRFLYIMIYEAMNGVMLHNSDAMYRQFTDELLLLFDEMGVTADALGLSQETYQTVRDDLYPLLRALGPVFVKDYKYSEGVDYSEALPEDYDDPDFDPQTAEYPILTYDQYEYLQENPPEEPDEPEEPEEPEEESEEDKAWTAAFNSDAYDRGYEDALAGNDMITEAPLPEDPDQYSELYLSLYAEKYLMFYESGYMIGLEDLNPKSEEYYNGMFAAEEAVLADARRDALTESFKASYSETPAPREDGEPYTEDYLLGYAAAYSENYEIYYEASLDYYKELNLYHLGGFVTQIKDILTQHYPQTNWALVKAMDPRYDAVGIIGDADGDGSVTILDVTVIQRRLAEYDVNDPENVELCGDVDEDGELSILDVTLIQRYLASYTVAHPIGQYITE